MSPSTGGRVDVEPWSDADEVLLLSGRTLPFALAWFDSGERTVTLMVRPSVEDVTLVGDNAPSIYFAREAVPVSELSRMIQRSCDAGKVLPIDINFERYIAWRIQQAREFAVVAQAPSPGLVDPEVN